MMVQQNQRQRCQRKTFWLETLIELLQYVIASASGTCTEVTQLITSRIWPRLTRISGSNSFPLITMMFFAKQSGAALR